MKERTAFPKIYPGCWNLKTFLRRYKTAWQAMRREDPMFRAKELQQQRRYRETPKGKRTNARVSREWRQAHPRRVKASNKRWNLLNRVRRCHFCGKRGKSGRGALKRVARMVPVPGGILVRRVLDYCGSC